MSNKKVFFTKKLLDLHQNDNSREMPWKGESEPYKIWLSEIILQQTRAEQGLDYYYNFINKYPNICQLANAKDEDVFLLWQGLGYYNRCRNLLATARFICNHLNGTFPDKYEDILALKGVGAYTAAAISSFAFSLPYAVLDGNVYRVLSRYFGIEEPIDSSKSKKEFALLAQELLDKKKPAFYNQAIMDLGATLCSPKKTKCSYCPLSAKCSAYHQNLVHLLPVKLKKITVQKRFFNFVVFRWKDELWIEQRPSTGIWGDLHQFFLLETEESASLEFIKQNSEFAILPIDQLQFHTIIIQRLTHQLIESKFYSLELNSREQNLPKDGFWIKLDQLDQYAFPKTLLDFINGQYFV